MAKTERPRYERLAQRAEHGAYELIEPFDYLLMTELPVEGTDFAGLYQIGTTTRQLSKKFKQVPPSQISARIRSLHVQQLIRKVRMLGADVGGRGKPQAGSAWQITEAGVKLLATWKEKNGN